MIIKEDGLIERWFARLSLLKVRE